MATINVKVASSLKTPPCISIVCISHLQHISYTEQFVCPSHTSCHLRATYSLGSGGGVIVASWHHGAEFDFCIVSIYKWVTYKIIKVLISLLKIDIFKL